MLLNTLTGSYGLSMLAEVYHTGGTWTTLKQNQVVSKRRHHVVYWRHGLGERATTIDEYPFPFRSALLSTSDFPADCSPMLPDIVPRRTSKIKPGPFVLCSSFDAILRALVLGLRCPDASARVALLEDTRI